MTPLAAALRDEIAHGGPITLARYMEQALYHPTLGYYRNRDPLGAAGDFTTAPEISQMFGEVIGAWLAVAWRQMGCPSPVRLVELGPGRGTLMNDALRASRGVANFHRSLDLHLVEISATLRAAQAAALDRAGVSATWHESLADIPGGPLLLIANEFFDALPIRQWQRTTLGWRERLVGGNDAEPEQFRWVLSDAAAPCEPPATLRDAPPGTIWESAAAAEDVARAVAARLATEGGAALVIDYGYTEQRGGESLQALRSHRRHDPLLAPGTADITTHVDFAGLTQTARRGGARVYGPLDQGPFLLGLGLAARAERLRESAMAHQRPDQATAIATAYKRLIAPTEMGSLFKALAMTGPHQPAPPGFAELGLTPATANHPR